MLPTQDGVKPYGLIGLPLSTAAIIVLSTLLGGIIIVLAFGIEIWIVGLHIAVLGVGVIRDGLVHDPSSQSSRLVLLCLSILIYVTIALVIFGFARLRGGQNWRVLVGWHPWSPLSAKRSFWIVSFVTLLFSLIANQVLATYYPPSQDWVTLPKGALPIALFFVLATICAPMTEELFFRGWLYTGLRAKLGRVTAVTITSVLFALAHYEATFLYALAVLPVGFALGIIRESENSLRASMSFHALFNSVAFVLIFFGV